MNESDVKRMLAEDRPNAKSASTACWVCQGTGWENHKTRSPCLSCVAGDARRLEVQFDKAKDMSQVGPSSEVLSPDPVQHPAHYTAGKVECIDAIEAATGPLAGMNAILTGQVLKYVWRWPLKGRPLEDLEKARWYLDRLIARIRGPQS